MDTTKSNTSRRRTLRKAVASSTLLILLAGCGASASTIGDPRAAEPSQVEPASGEVEPSGGEEVEPSGGEEQVVAQASPPTLRSRVTASLDAQRPAFIECFDDSRTRAPTIRGTMVVRFAVAADGSFTEVSGLNPSFSEPPASARLQSPQQDRTRSVGAASNVKSRGEHQRPEAHTETQKMSRRRPEGSRLSSCAMSVVDRSRVEGAVDPANSFGFRVTFHETGEVSIEDTAGG